MPGTMKESVDSPFLIQIADSAPNMPNGSASSTDSGSDHFSYCAARPRARAEVPLDFFSW